VKVAGSQWMILAGDRPAADSRASSHRNDEPLDVIATDVEPEPAATGHGLVPTDPVSQSFLTNLTAQAALVTVPSPALRDAYGNQTTFTGGKASRAYAHPAEQYARTQRGPGQSQRAFHLDVHA
jgi:hypothetical protein